MLRPAYVAINLPLVARAIDSTSPPSRVCDSASRNPVKTSKHLTLLSSDTTKICRPLFEYASGVMTSTEGAVTVTW